uniref:Uncharacterized protein n=1 Tax=Compsopogon caeruleus TaxID=31354 RepID=A0A7S1XH64_9RHOD|mmetsp:Transcript_9067/g.18345  ORF Transcript_9067/g.18345 Transcript_9067/m.18345 type:complete len:583 (+) Transcript_9067:80-1828(+)
MGRHGRINVSAAVESSIDVPSVREVWADGTYTSEPDTHFSLTSAAAKSYVTRALSHPLGGAQLGRGEVTEDGETEDGEATAELGRRWTSRVVTFLDSALYELSRTVAVIDAIAKTAKSTGGLPASGFPPILELKPGQMMAATGAVDENEMAVILMAKQRALASASAFLQRQMADLRAWIKEDNLYGERLVALRGDCGGTRRDVSGRALIEIGSAEAVRVRRAPFGVGRVAFSVLEFRLDRIPIESHAWSEALMSINPAGYMEAKKEIVNEENESEASATQLVRRARISSYRRDLFNRLCTEASRSMENIQVSSKRITWLCADSVVLQIDKTSASAREVVNARSHASCESQFLSCVTESVALSSSNLRIFPRIGTMLRSRHLALELETALDDAARCHHLLIDWSRGEAGEFRATVFSSSSDGDGPSKRLSSFAPSNRPGRILVTPAFGVILPSQAETYTFPHRLEDVPGSFTISAQGREVQFVLAVQMSIRLLEALEMSSRMSTETLDIDRQASSVVILFPGHDTCLKAKVTNEGPDELPEVYVTINDRSIPFPSAREGGRVARWRQLLASTSQSLKLQSPSI